MAHFKSVVTTAGAQLLSSVLANGGNLVLTRAAAGSGVPDADPAGQGDLIAEETSLSVSMGDKVVSSGDPVVMVVPVQVTNASVTARVYVREIALFAQSGSAEILFSYSYLEGDDGDNVIDPPRLGDGVADVEHTFDLGHFVTNQEAAAITVIVSAGTYVTEARLNAYAAPLVHTHAATAVTESTGETVETVQRRQDYDIAAMKEQLDTGFTGTTLTHTVSVSELTSWTGYAGSGYPEGTYDEANARLYA